MDENAKRFARKILLAHVLILLVVLGSVVAAGREIYNSTRDQVISQAEERQKLLARQTANGIESHYQSIFNDLDLVRREETDETGAEKPSTEPADTTLLTPPCSTDGGAAGRACSGAGGRSASPVGGANADAWQARCSVCLPAMDRAVQSLGRSSGSSLPGAWRSCSR